MESLPPTHLLPVLIDQLQPCHILIIKVVSNNPLCQLLHASQLMLALDEAVVRLLMQELVWRTGGEIDITFSTQDCNQLHQ